VVAAPAFAIRKPAVAVFTLEDYVAAGIMTSGQANALKVAVEARKNILVAGGTSSGKTTLTNALLAEVAKTSDRVVLIEDTRELQCKAPNLVALRTKDGVISLSDLVRSSLRLRPDRIPIGEVRGAEALDLLKAWGTGHPGGIGTIHAGTALGALRRLEQLIQEAVVTVPRALIAETINVILPFFPVAAPIAAWPSSLASRGSDLPVITALRHWGTNHECYIFAGTMRHFDDRIRDYLSDRRPSLRCWLQHAVGAAAQSDPAIG
jgi:P-type conjugative transfer ATPase TrbB